MIPHDTKHARISDGILLRAPWFKNLFDRGPFNSETSM